MTDPDREPHNPYIYPGLHSDEKQATAPGWTPVTPDPVAPAHPTWTPPSPASATKQVATRPPDMHDPSWTKVDWPSLRASPPQPDHEQTAMQDHWAIKTDQDLACELETLPFVVFVRDRWNKRVVATLPTRSLPYQIRVRLACDHADPSQKLDFEWCEETGAVAYRGTFAGLFLDWMGDKIKPGDPVGGPDDPWG